MGFFQFRCLSQFQNFKSTYEENQFHFPLEHIARIFKVVGNFNQYGRWTELYYFQLSKLAKLEELKLDGIDMSGNNAYAQTILTMKNSKSVHLCDENLSSIVLDQLKNYSISWTHFSANLWFDNIPLNNFVSSVNLTNLQLKISRLRLPQFFSNILHKLENFKSLKLIKFT